MASGRRCSAWTLAGAFALMLTAPAALASLPPVARSGLHALSHEPSIEAAVDGLRKGQLALERAIVAGDPEGIHEAEAQVDEALHGLELEIPLLPDASQERATELLGQGFEIVDALHDAAEAGDLRVAEGLARDLGPLLDEIESLFLGGRAIGARVSAWRADRHPN